MSILGLRNLLTIQRDERGASAVEFALLLPVLMIVIMGIVQFGFIFFHYISITHAAREGARWAALEQTDAQVRAKVKASAPGLTISDADIAIDPAGDRSGRIGDPVKVTVQHRTPVIMGALTGFGSSLLLGSSATQRIE